MAREPKKTPVRKAGFALTCRCGCRIATSIGTACRYGAGRDSGRSHVKSRNLGSDPTGLSGQSGKALGWGARPP